MSRNTGAVRFPDNALMYFVYDGTVDIARPRLFPTPQAADDAWGDLQKDDRLRRGPTPGDKVEIVAVMPYFSNGDETVRFMSTASRAEARITGARSRDQADAMNNDDTAFVPP